MEDTSTFAFNLTILMAIFVGFVCAITFTYKSDQNYLKENGGTLIEKTGVIVDKIYQSPIYGHYTYRPEEFYFILDDINDDSDDVFKQSVSLDDYYKYELDDEYVYSSHYE